MKPPSAHDTLPCFGIYRALTFLYLPARAFWQLLCPSLLSYDWQMASIPLLGAASTTASPAADPRAAAAAAFYAGLAALAAKLIPGRRRKGAAEEEATSKSEVSFKPSFFRFRRGKIRPITLHSSASHYITFIATLHYTA